MLADLELTGSMVHSGEAFSMIGLCGLAVPLVGGFADKLKAHATSQLVALAGYIAAMLMFAFAPRVEFVPAKRPMVTGTSNLPYS